MNALILGYFSVDPVLLKFYTDYAEKMKGYGYNVFRYELGFCADEADFGGAEVRRGRLEEINDLLLLPGLYAASKGNLEFIEMQAMSRAPAVWLRTYLNLRHFGREFKKCLVSYDVRHVLFNHQFSGYHMIARRICEELAIPFTYWHPGFLPGTMSFDYSGQLAESELHRRLVKDGLELRAEWIDLGRDYIDLARKGQYLRPGKSNKSNQAVVELVKEKKKYGNIILVAGSNDYRTGVLPESYKKSSIHSVHYKSSDQLFRDVVGVAESSSYIVYKPHPNLYPGRSGVEEISSRSMIVYDVAIQDLLSEVDVSVSICSSAAYEALIFGVPAVVVGSLPGINLGFFYQVVDSRQELGATLEQVALDGVSTDRKIAFDNFIGYCLSEYFFQHGKYACPLVRRHLDDALMELVSTI